MTLGSWGWGWGWGWWFKGWGPQVRLGWRLMTRGPPPPPPPPHLAAQSIYLPSCRPTHPPGPEGGGGGYWLWFWVQVLETTAPFIGLSRLDSFWGKQGQFDGLWTTLGFVISKFTAPSFHGSSRTTPSNCHFSMDLCQILICLIICF